MKTFDWSGFLRHHAIFSVLRPKEISWLLHDKVSTERFHPAGSTVLQIGEIGDSVFLIGIGSMEAILPASDGDRISLSVMKKGEVFGEMAAVKHGPVTLTLVGKLTFCRLHYPISCCSSEEE